MTALIVLAVLSVIGIGAAVWIFKNEEKAGADGNVGTATLDLKNQPEVPAAETIPEKPSDRKQRSSILSKLLNRPKKEKLPTALSEPDQPQPEPKEPSSLISKIVGKLNLSGLMDKLKRGQKGRGATEAPETVPLPSLKDFMEEEKERNQQNEPLTGTASLTTTPADKPSDEQILPIIDNAEPDLQTQLDELQEKYDRLDKLFKEKSTELTSTKESLQNEINNRAEFNKVKDILEKELKDVKEKTRSLETESQGVNKEVETYKNQTKELEDKVSLLENQLKEKETEINDLVKRLQTFASPTTAVTPPKIEEEIKPQEPAPQVWPEKEDTKPVDETPQAVPEADPIPTPEPSEQPEQEEPEPVNEQNKPKFVLNLDGEEADASKEQPNDEQGSTQVSGALEAEPPEPYEEHEEDTQEQSFLKLQPDIISDDSGKTLPTHDSGPNEGPGPDSGSESSQDDQDKSSDNNHTKE